MILTWLKVRRRLAWWCAMPGCWRPSHVVTMHGKVLRGNLCACCLLEELSAIRRVA
jgi:hypothetical protein